MKNIIKKILLKFRKKINQIKMNDIINPYLTNLNNNGYTNLQLAILSNETDKVRNILLCDITNKYIDIKSRNGETALNIAVGGYNIEIIKMLLCQNPDINTIDNKGNTPLHNAVNSYFSDYMLNICKLLVDNGANQKIKNQDGDTVLHLALKERDLELFNYLISCGPEITTDDGYYNTLLHIAASRPNHWQNIIEIYPDTDNNISLDNSEPILEKPILENSIIESYPMYIDLFKFLINKKLNINATDTYNNTPLHIALSHCNYKIADILIKHGANINIKNIGNQIALHVVLEIFIDRKPRYLYENYILKIVNVLLKSTTDIDVIDVNGYTPLHLALKNRRINTVKMLLKHGVNPMIKTRDGESVLHLAVIYLRNNFNIINYLIKIKRVDINEIDNEGNTPLIIAFEMYNLEAAEILLDNGADPNIKNNDGKSALHFVMKYSFLPNIYLLHHLLNAGANVNEIDNEGNSPLIVALSNTNFKFAKILFDHGANPTIKNKNGKSALHFAVKYALFDLDVQLLVELIKAGANVNDIDNEGNTPLIKVLQSYNSVSTFNIVTILLENGANLNIKNKKGQTAITLDTNFHIKNLIKSYQ